MSFIFFMLSLTISLEQVQATGKAGSPANVKAIIFDCDGTLVDNSNCYYLEWQYALRRQGYELTSDEFWHFMNKNALVGAPGADTSILKFCCKLLGRDCANELLNDKDKFSAELHAIGFPPIEATVNFLQQLVIEKEKFGFKLGLASGANKKAILSKLRHLGIEKCFDVIVSGDDDLYDYNDPEGRNKPKPYVYLHTAKLLGVLPEQCVAIEDSKVGVCSAVDAGCITVAVPNACTIHQDLSYAHLKITSFKGISPTDFLQMIADCRTPTVKFAI